jgi:hypothetical protein
MRVAMITISPSTPKATSDPGRLTVEPGRQADTHETVDSRGIIGRVHQSD